MVNKEDVLCVLGACNFVLPPLQGLGDVGVAAGGNATLTPVCTGHALSGLSTTISKTAWICDARTWTVTTQLFNRLATDQLIAQQQLATSCSTSFRVFRGFQIPRKNYRNQITHGLTVDGVGSLGRSVACRGCRGILVVSQKIFSRRERGGRWSFSGWM